MRYVAAVLVLLAAVGVGQSGEKEVIKRLEEAGVSIRLEGYIVIEGSVIEVALPDLCELKGLRCLEVRKARLTESHLRTICALPLSGLILNYSLVTDAHLKHVARIRGLEGLGLVKTQITDAGLEHLSKSGHLTILSLEDTAVTDVGLRHLEGCSRLEHLFLCRCPKITNEGVARLQKALPNCHIVR